MEPENTPGKGKPSSKKSCSGSISIFVGVAVQTTTQDVNATEQQMFHKVTKSHLRDQWFRDLLSYFRIRPTSTSLVVYG